MKPGKLIAAVRRELTANPKKAAVLALLLAAAAWFWGPLVWRMFGGAKPATPGPAQVVGQSPDRQPPSVNSAAARPTSGNWRDLVAARRQDPLAQPATFDPDWPQPFKVQALQTAATGDGVGVPTVLTPAQAGLVLQSILYGKAKRAAMINGEIYREGSEVAISTPGVDVIFQVARIDRSSVSLECYGRTYRLEFPRPTVTQSQTRPRSSQPVPAGAQP